MTPAAEATARSIAPARPQRRASGVKATRMASAAVAAPGIARPRTRTAPSRPRPVAQPRPGIAETVLGRLSSLSEHRMLDRLIRGRMWIGLVAFALIGIVAMQLAILELNTGIGHSLERVARLQRENPEMSIENSAAAAGENVEPKAVARGMETAPVATIQFLTSSPGDAANAARILRHPSGVSEADSTATQTPTSSSPSTESSGTTATTGSSSIASQTEIAPTSDAPAGETTAAGSAPTESSTPSTVTSPQSSVAPAAESRETPSSSSVSTDTGAGGGTQAAPQE
jgi:hypothetical protein